MPSFFLQGGKMRAVRTDTLSFRWTTVMFACLNLAAAPLEASGMEEPLEVLFQLPLAPSGLTITASGSYLLGVSYEEQPQNRAVEMDKTGASKPFPTPSLAQARPGEALPLDAVEGLQAMKDGIVWILDNGRRSEVPPKVVAWDHEKGRLHRVIHLVPPAVNPASFLDDLVVDPEAPFLYVCDPANGAEAALVVVDLSSGLARRVLQGHPAVAPVEGLNLSIDGLEVVTRRLDGTVADPQGGVNPMALDRKAEWLYFGPMRSTRLYRLRTAFLKDATLAPDKLAGMVEEYADKPLCDSISIDAKGNIYVADIAAKGIGMIAAGNREYRLLVRDPRLLWPDGLCFGVDGKLYFFNNARKAQSITGALGVVGELAPAPNYLFRIRTPASGRVGD